MERFNNALSKIVSPYGVVDVDNAYCQSGGGGVDNAHLMSSPIWVWKWRLLGILPNQGVIMSEQMNTSSK